MKESLRYYPLDSLRHLEDLLERSISRSSKQDWAHLMVRESLENSPMRPYLDNSLQELTKSLSRILVILHQLSTHFSMIKVPLWHQLRLALTLTMDSSRQETENFRHLGNCSIKRN